MAAGRPNRAGHVERLLVGFHRTRPCHHRQGLAPHGHPSHVHHGVRILPVPADLLEGLGHRDGLEHPGEKLQHAGLHAALVPGETYLLRMSFLYGGTSCSSRQYTESRGG